MLQDLTATYVQGFVAHNGYLVLPTGSYGTDYDMRAMITQVGLGALKPEEAIYPLAQVDKNLQMYWIEGLRPPHPGRRAAPGRRLLVADALRLGDGFLVPRTRSTGS